MMNNVNTGGLTVILSPGRFNDADDKVIYYFVPSMIKYYLGEEPILSNAPTYLPYYKPDMDYVLANFDSLVIKDVAKAGGYGIVDEPVVWKSGLTRFSRNPDSFIVNSSQGGGFKDTWVMSED